MCMISGCNEPVLARGWCEIHYSRWLRHGNPETLKIKSSRRGAAQAFLLECAASTSDECIDWPFAKGESGYGKVRFRGKYTQASRAVCTIAHGEPPEPRYEAAHSCGRGANGCVNGKHLSWKTPKDNQGDRIVHGTHLVGGTHPQAILTERDIPKIRSLLAEKNLTQTEIGKIFGVSKAAINNIAQGRWRHV